MAIVIKIPQVVLYHMCEVYSAIGIDNINVEHVARGAANFLVVALGGTIIGMLKASLQRIIFRFNCICNIYQA